MIQQPECRQAEATLGNTFPVLYRSIRFVISFVRVMWSFWSNPRETAFNTWWLPVVKVMEFGCELHGFEPPMTNQLRTCQPTVDYSPRPENDLCCHFLRKQTETKNQWMHVKFTPTCLDTPLDDHLKIVNMGSKTRSNISPFKRGKMMFIYWTREIAIIVHDAWF